MAKSDRRRKPSRNLPQTKRILVVAEGLVTEMEYIEAVKRLHRIGRDTIRIEHGHTDPIGIVRQAKAMMKEASKTDMYDQAWCVFDVEAKSDQQSRFGLLEALDAAKRTTGKEKIKCAVSNPCFEIWLLWHCTDQTGPITSDAVQRRCLERGITSGNTGKNIRDTNDLILNKYDAARERAILMEQTHDRNGTIKPEDRNPSSGMYELIDAIHAAFPPHE